ncbi:hypothetical protein ACFYZ8_33235 [Streptomyces sp. NPDC001668]|uniref:hypothetical protein n=1 Tax=Streptomyces sp. NPDC001668 TaxID=3364598 RepID=UPI0036BF75A1
MRPDDGIRRIASTEYAYDPDSLPSLVDAARRLRHDFRRDHGGYEGGSMSEGALERGAAVRREYCAKAWDIVNDLALMPAQPTPGGLPSAETAAAYLYGEYRGRAMTRARAADTLVCGPYGLTGGAATALVNWLAEGGYLTALDLDARDGRVRGVYRAGRPTVHHDKLADQPRWLSATMTVTRRAAWAPLTGVSTVYMHPDEIDAHFAH